MKLETLEVLVITFFGAIVIDFVIGILVSAKQYEKITNEDYTA